VSAALRVATFPLMTPRYADPRLWRSCLRIAKKGLFAWRPDTLEPFLRQVHAVETARERQERDALARGRVPGWDA
jgi:hypothetical protein